jgi:hypothetical protein
MARPHAIARLTTILLSTATVRMAEQPPAAPSDAENLAKKLANPISDLVSR